MNTNNKSAFDKMNQQDQDDVFEIVRQTYEHDYDLLVLDYAKTLTKSTLQGLLKTFRTPEVDTAMEEGCRYERAFGDRSDVG